MKQVPRKDFINIRQCLQVADTIEIGVICMMMPSIFGESLFDDFDDWFDFRMPKMPDVDRVLYGRNARNMMKTDVREKDGKYEMSIDLPGFDKNDVKVALNDGYLTISAEKGLDKEDKDKNKKYLRKERYEGSMTRSFYVGDDITDKDINASYKNGVLTLELPKKDQKQIEKNDSHLIEVH